MGNGWEWLLKLCRAHFPDPLTRTAATMAEPARPVEAAPPALRSARSLARLLDSSLRIPGTSFRIGLDPILGLIPGIGDFAGVLLSTSILFSAARVGVPGATLLRMGVNIGLEAVIGTIPLIGDLFDAGWRANVRNVRLMEAHLADPAVSSRANARWLRTLAAGIGAALILIVGAAGWLVVTLLQALGFG